MIDLLQFILFYITFCLTTVNSSKNDGCPSQWNRYENKCYLFDTTKRNFYASVESCRANNSVLASIHSKEENRFIADNLPANNSRDYWLGGIANGTHTFGFYWLDGSKSDYQNLTQEQNKYILMPGFVTISSTGLWKIAVSAESLKPSVCQKTADKKATVETTTSATLQPESVKTKKVSHRTTKKVNRVLDVINNLDTNLTQLLSKSVNSNYIDEQSECVTKSELLDVQQQIDAIVSYLEKLTTQINSMLINKTQ